MNTLFNILLVKNDSFFAIVDTGTWTFPSYLLKENDEVIDKKEYIKSYMFEDFSILVDVDNILFKGTDIVNLEGEKIKIVTVYIDEYLGKPISNMTNVRSSLLWVKKKTLKDKQIFKNVDLGKETVRSIDYI